MDTFRQVERWHIEWKSECDWLKIGQVPDDYTSKMQNVQLEKISICPYKERSPAINIQPVYTTKQSPPIEK